MTQLSHEPVPEWWYDYWRDRAMAAERALTEGATTEKSMLRRMLNLTYFGEEGAGGFPAIKRFGDEGTEQAILELRLRALRELIEEALGLR